MSRHEDIRDGLALMSPGEVDPLDASVIQCLRAAHVAARDKALAPPCGLGQGFAALHALLAEHAIRPLEFLPPRATGTSPDEACLARFVRTAAEGDREAALLNAFELLRPDIAFLSVPLACDLGLGLRRSALRRGRAPRLN